MSSVSSLPPMHIGARERGASLSQTWQSDHCLNGSMVVGFEPETRQYWARVPDHDYLATSAHVASQSDVDKRPINRQNHGLEKRIGAYGYRSISRSSYNSMKRERTENKVLNSKIVLIMRSHRPEISVLSITCCICPV
ncbi:hypothetical protein TNCV_860241 [Trichonephila clavipes]|nr:hypothetical protein TNCV_860241 [Trichonephila clavipes]